MINYTLSSKKNISLELYLHSIIMNFRVEGSGHLIEVTESGWTLLRRDEAKIRFVILSAVC